MSEDCSHEGGIRTVTPSALGCEECLKIGSPWVHLRICRTCGRRWVAGDDSPHRHATVPTSTRRSYPDHRGL